MNWKYYTDIMWSRWFANKNVPVAFVRDKNMHRANRYRCASLANITHSFATHLYGYCGSRATVYEPCIIKTTAVIFCISDFELTPRFIGDFGFSK